MIRVLLADDHPLFLRGLRQLLEAEDGFEVVAEAGDGAEALKLALDNDVELAILDVMMPRMTGVQAAAGLARRRIRVIMLSSSDGAHHLRAARRAGAAGYLFKSTAESQLVDACRAVMRGELVYPGDQASRDVSDGTLTPRETEILKLIAEGWSSQRIAEELVISVHTVDRHRQNVLEKLGVHDRVELTRYAIREGLIEP